MGCNGNVEVCDLFPSQLPYAVIDQRFDANLRDIVRNPTVNGTGGQKTGRSRVGNIACR